MYIDRMYIAFLDLKAAFDTVDHSSLWKILTILGAPRKITTLFQRMYSNAESCVRVNNKVSTWFSINSGVPQGCVAAPDLFNCIIDHLMDRVCSRGPGIRLGSYLLTDLEYTDDTVLFCSTLDQLDESLRIYQEEANKLGLKVSWAKTKLMHIGGEAPPPLHIDGEEVEFVSSFTYLGSTVTNNGNLTPEINRRRSLAASVMKSLWKPLWRHQSISRNTKLRIYNSSVLSVLLYGAETWPLTKTLAARINGFDTRALRTIEGIKWHHRVSNSILRERTQQPPASRLAAQRRMRWFGHIQRLPPEHPTHTILHFDPKTAGWRRPRGKPRTRWMDIITRDLQHLGLSMAEAVPIALDQPKWRGLVNLIGSTHDAAFDVEQET